MGLFSVFMTNRAADTCPNHHKATGGKCKVSWCPYRKR